MKAPEGAAACVQCGALLPAEQPSQQARPAAGGRTIVGVAAADVMAQVPKGPVATAAAARTIVGMPRAALPGAAAAGAAAGPTGAEAAGSAEAAPTPVAPEDPTARTMIGVAMPGIAPIDADSDPDEPPDDPTERQAEAGPGAEQPSTELGATVSMRQHARAALRPVGSKNPDLGRRRMDFAFKRPKQDRVQARRQAPLSRRALAVIATAAVLAIVAVLFALFWPSTPPLTARVRADDSGKELVEVRCSSCPDGTELRIGDATATVTGMVARVALSTPLSLGENRLKVHIDRPGGGRDETVGVVVPVAYRIRPDLQTLQGEHPAIGVVVEAAEGTQISLNDKPVAMLQGKAIEMVDLTGALTGTSAETATLNRKIPYAVTPPGGPTEQGELNVAIGIVPLQLDAPRPRVIIQASSFLLAGRTMKDAEVFAGGRPIRVQPDGSFSQSMSVSAVGSTQLAVRAKAEGMAPRLARVAVQRVDSLDAAAREFIAAGPITYSELAANIKQQTGKAVVIAGEVVEARSQNNLTVILLDIPASHGCVAKKPEPRACHVRLLQGESAAWKQGSRLTAYGYVAREFTTPGGDAIAEIDVAFILKGLR